MLTLDANIIWIFVNLIITYWVLRIFLFKPVHSVMQKRQEIISQSLADASTAKSEAESMKQRYEETMGDAQKKADALLAQAQEHSQKEYDAMIDAAKMDAQEIRKRADQAIQEERERAIRDIQRNAADMVLLAVQKVAGSTVDKEENKKMVDAFLAEAGEKV